MRLGVGTYCYMWSIGVEGASPAHPMSSLALLNAAALAGIRVVQLGPNLPIAPEEVPALAEFSHSRRLELEIGTKGLDPDNIRQNARLCLRLEATILRTVDLYEGTAPSPQELERGLRALLPILEHHGVRLALENALTPARTVSTVLDVIGSEWLGVTLDTVNSLAIPEGTAHVVSELARHTICLHVKDFQVRRIWHSMGFTVEGTPAGQGQLNVPWLIQQVRAAGRDPNAILELWVPKQESVEQTIEMEKAWVTESLSYLRTLLPE